MKVTAGNSMLLLGHILILLGGVYLLVGQVKTLPISLLSVSPSPPRSKTATLLQGALERVHSPFIYGETESHSQSDPMGTLPVMLSCVLIE